MGSQHYYHTSNSCECKGVNGEALQLHSVYKKLYFYCKSRENLYQYYKSHKNPHQVLQVMCSASECAMKSKVRMIKVLSPQYQAIPEKVSLVCCC